MAGNANAIDRSIGSATEGGDVAIIIENVPSATEKVPVVNKKNTETIPDVNVDRDASKKTKDVSSSVDAGSTEPIANGAEIPRVEVPTERI